MSKKDPVLQRDDDRMQYHALSSAQCLARLDADAGGLSTQEAESRLGHYGRNSLPQPHRPGLGRLFLRQFQSPLIYLLLLATLVSLLLGHRLDALFIGGILLLNAAIGTVQEYRANASAEALKRLVRHQAHVRRDGHLVRIDAEALVPGDIVFIESGGHVPADMRLIEATGLSVDESILTGESMPVAKVHDAPVAPEAVLGDRRTMLHAGTHAVEGRGLGVVVATGPATALGRIAAVLRDTNLEVAPPIIQRLQQLSRQIAIGTMAAIALLALVIGVQGGSISEIFLLAVALAVSAIPEGLPIAVTVALASATRRMARRHVIVRSLPAVEGLGACTLIASDKTGTLTQNRLTVDRVLLPSGAVIAPDGWQAADPDDVHVLLAIARASHWCNEAQDGSDGMPVGDTVDIALRLFARRLSPAGFNQDCDVVARLAYEPVNRFASVIMRQEGGALQLVAKGAVETIAGFCDDVPVPLLEQAEALAMAGYRVIALASGPVTEASEAAARRPQDLKLLGCVALLDPLRPEAAAAVARCRAAGITVCMVTGDHPATALTIARQLGFASHASEVVTGQELARLADDPAALAVRLAEARVFARTEPTQKLMIVRGLQAQGHIVAVTGDGVNDAPALHAADIGVAMGMSGADVTRATADLILTDDHFASIVGGVEEGRITYANIRKIVIFLLATGIAEIGIFLGALFLGLPMPLTAVQLLWLNVVTNGAQDVMLGFERGEGDELDQPPRRPDAAIIDRAVLTMLLPSAMIMTILSLGLFAWMLDGGATVESARNGVLFMMVLFQNVYVLSSRSQHRPFYRNSLLTNPWLMLGMTTALLLHVAALYVPPLQALLGTSPLSLEMLGWSLGAAACVLLVAEVAKAQDPRWRR